MPTLHFGPIDSGPLILRAVTATDLPIFYEQQLDPEATRMAAFPSREREAFMAHWGRILLNPTGTVRAIVFEEQVAGYMVSWNQDGTQELGYWLGAAFWGKGIATQALWAFLEIVPTRPLYAHVAKHNIGSLRVLQKCGFVIDHEEIDSPDDKGEPFQSIVLKLG